jgi:predicted kinase
MENMKMRKLVLIRGLPGSGKSTIAESLKNYIHMETDQFWGQDYAFDVSKLGEAHAWCQEQTRTWLKDGFDVVVSNTFTTKKELRPYFDIAKEFGITPNVYLAEGKFGSIHNVPEETLKRMATRFEYDISSMYSE